MARVRCFTRNGHDWGNRFPAIVLAARRLKTHSFVIDGEAVVLNDDGPSDFHALRGHRRGAEAMLVAFDLIEHNDHDLRDLSLIDRKRRLSKLIGKTKTCAIQYGNHLTATARPSSLTSAAWDWRASCRSGRTHHIAAGRRGCGSSRSPGKRGSAPGARGGVAVTGTLQKAPAVPRRKPAKVFRFVR
jgi:hypothetical protein